MEPIFKFVNGERIQCSEEEAQQIRARWEAEALKNQQNEYKQRRAEAFKGIPEQLDMLFHELKESGSITTDGEWFKHIESIKSSFPKTEV